VSIELPAPLKTVCRVAGVSRSAACKQRRRRRASAWELPARRRLGPVGALPDAELLAEIRRDLEQSPFLGEGHRKIWARLRRQRGIRTSRKRVLRLTREAGLLAPTPQVRKRAARLHEGTITVDVPDTLWATDATEAWTRQEGRCAVFAIVDHASNEVWYDAARRMDRFAAADLLRKRRSRLTPRMNREDLPRRSAAALRDGKHPEVAPTLPQHFAADTADGGRDDQAKR
jgi:putative transposase